MKEKQMKITKIILLTTIIALYLVFIGSLIYKQDKEIIKLKTYIQDQQQACIDFSLIGPRLEDGSFYSK